jgi:hypothetical protein
MPNGGIMPCCWVCHWGSRNTSESSVACEQHHLTTYLPLATLCSELILPNGDGQRRYFSGKEFSPEPDSMYEWLEVVYEDSRYPGIPQYFKEPVEIASLGEFATWNKDQQIKTSQARHEQKRQELAELDF